uniref:Uncharacterized protein n=1 Tax=Arundo donax TaxID=35708 RepID=A0A0A9CME4_ARUDO
MLKSSGNSSREQLNKKRR